MVQPDIDPAPRPKPGLSRPALVGITGALIGGFFLFTQMTTPTPDAAPPTSIPTPTTRDLSFGAPTTTTTPPSFQTRGEPLEWTDLAWFEDVRFFGFYPVAGQTVFFTDDHGTGLVRHDLEGSGDTLVGFEGAAVQEILQMGDRLIALGVDADNRPTSWVTADGLAWTSSRLPLDTGFAFYRFNLTHASDHLTIAIAAPSLETRWADVLELVRRAAAERYGIHVEASLERYHFGNEAGFEIILRGPLGIPLGQRTPQDLGLDPSLFPTPEEEEDLGPPRVWVTYDGATWQTYEAPDLAFPWLLTSLPDGRIIVRGLQTLATTDGLTWETADNPPEMWNVRSWGDRLVGLRSRETGEYVVRYDGEWETLDVHSFLTTPSRWSLTGLGASGDGVALIAQRWGPSPGSSPPQTNSIEVGEYTLTQTSRYLELGRQDVVLVRVERSLWDFLTVDLDTATVTFLNRNTREPIATFSFEDLARLETTHTLRFTPLADQVFMFTADGEDWVVQDVMELSGGERLAWTFVVDGRVFLVANKDDPWAITIGPTRIWWADAPDQP